MTFVCNLQGIFNINMQICWIISILVPFLDILVSKFPKPDFFQPTIFMFREEIYLTKHVISIKIKYNASDLIYSQKATILRDFGAILGPNLPKILAYKEMFQKSGCTSFVDLRFTILMQNIRKNKAANPVLSI